MQNFFSYPVKLEDMSQSGQLYHLKATPEELKLIASLMQIPAVKSFSSDLKVTLHKRNRLVDVEGNFDCIATQTSVVSLENFDKSYHGDFSLKFDTEPKEYDLDEEDINADIPDTMENDAIDLGAISLEQFALNIDDFPRKEGEVFRFVSEFDEETTKAVNPFAVLQKLKK